MRWLIAVYLSITLISQAAADEIVDLELALAVDASGSVDDGEFALQLKGIASGFRDPDVLKAIRSGPLCRVAVNLIVWAEPQAPKDMSGWQIIAESCEHARIVETDEACPSR